MEVYNSVFAIARVYLGPATEKFIARQCKYLKVEPSDLKKAHLQQLAWLSKNAASTVMVPAEAEKMAKKIEAA